MMLDRGFASILFGQDRRFPKEGISIETLDGITTMSRYDDEICLPFTHNKFGDAVIVSELFSERLLCVDYFARSLERSLQIWRDRGVKGVEIVISPEHSHLIPELTKRGFAFYLVDVDRLIMNCWIGEQPSQFPTKPFIFYSVSGLVVDPYGRILVVRQQRRELCWEFPGGMSRNDENLLETAEAKVLEKTGVIAKAQCIITLSHNNKVKHNAISGFFFSCLMKFVRQEEIATGSDDILDAKWLTRSELRQLQRHEFFDPHRRIFDNYEKWIEAGLVSETGDIAVNMFSYFFTR